MNGVIRSAIDRPVSVISVVLMVVMFGLLALAAIPVQLAPDVRKPIITITTNWFGAAPAEVEREITNRQEDVLKGLEGLQEMVSSSRNGQAEITLEFAPNQNMDRSLLLVSNRLDRVNGYPDRADEPVLQSSGSEDSPIAWMVMQRLPGETRDIHTFGDFVEDVVKARLERVPGVSRVNVFGGSQQEMHVIVEPRRLAEQGITVDFLLDVLRGANVALSAGYVDEGKRRYTVRTEGELNTLDAVRQVLVLSRVTPDGRQVRVTVGDVADVQYGYNEPAARIRRLGAPAMAINAVRESGANVIETMKGLRAALAELNESVLPRNGVFIDQVYDETIYINQAIEMVTANLWMGAGLAAVILLVFLKSIAATLIIGLAMPVSVIGTFVVMSAMGASINVISLAGLAFAVGMVVDAAIVVLENIFRMRQQGLPIAQACYEGARQVWVAVLVSVLTTVMVFIPLLNLELEAGQLFRDIALAISVSVSLSLLVSITVIPALARRLLAGDAVATLHETRRIFLLDSLAGLFGRVVLGFNGLLIRYRLLGLIWVTGLMTASLAVSVLLLPKLEYLPEGNRNLIFGVMLPPPGYNLETMTQIAQRIENAARPLWASVSGPEPTADGTPKIQNFFFVATRANTFIGAAAVQGERVAELIPVLRGPMFEEPGTFGFVTQPSIFGRGIGGGRAVNLDISGPDLGAVIGVAQQAAGRVAQVLPMSAGHQFRPQPGLEFGAPEVRLYPDRVRLADAGVTARSFGTTVEAFNEGVRVAEVTVDGKRLDLLIKGNGERAANTQDIGYLPIVTPEGVIVPMSSLGQVVMTAGPTEIRHLERVRTVTLEIRPAPDMALESAMEILQTQVMAPLIAEGLPTGVQLGLSGTADELRQTWNAMKWQLAVALVIVYLVMAIQFESFWYPLIIVTTVPAAMAGAVLGLVALNTVKFQPLDMLTMLGFVILIGVVVNNAILLVEQTLFHIREKGMDTVTAIQEATRNRLRPIFMSSLTSIFGMLPLVLFPGAGTELYRGLGAVVIGGLTLSTFITLALVPPMLGLFLRRTPVAVAQPAEAIA